MGKYTPAPSPIPGILGRGVNLKTLLGIRDRGYLSTQNEDAKILRYSRVEVDRRINMMELKREERLKKCKIKA